VGDEKFLVLRTEFGAAGGGGGAGARSKLKGEGAQDNERIGRKWPTSHNTMRCRH
jgi:hypothetical protein